MKMSRYLKICCLFAALSWLSGCVNMDEPLGSKNFQVETPQARQEALSKLQFWHVVGAFSIRQDKNEARSAEIANYDWNQFGHTNYRIHIASTADLYRVSILSHYGSVTLWKNTTLAYTAKTPEGLMQKALGWQLPVRELFYWMKGMPAPKQKWGAFETSYDRYGHLVSLRQEGWSLRYGAYRKIENIDLPQEIYLDRPGISVKIIARYWTLTMHPFAMPQSI